MKLTRNQRRHLIVSAFIILLTIKDLFFVKILQFWREKSQMNIGQLNLMMKLWEI
jgi:hypothetical protein